MVRQAHHERNPSHTVRPELVEGWNLRTNLIAISLTLCIMSLTVRLTR